MARPELYPVKKLVGFDQDTIKSIEKWRARQKPIPNASEAIRRLVEMALATAGPAPKRSKKADALIRRLGAYAGMAGKMIDQLADKSASPEEQAKRKRRLMKGPPEFREMRGDLPKPKG